MKKNKKIIKNLKSSAKTPKSATVKTRKDSPSGLGENKNISAPGRLQVSEKAIIYICGEYPMVAEYAEICTIHGYDVYGSINNLQKSEINPPLKEVSISNNVPKNTSLAIELTNINKPEKRKNIEKLANSLPETAPILTSSITITATEQCSWIPGKHRLVGISALPTFIEKPLVEAAPTIYTPRETLDVVTRFYRSLNKEIEIVQDRIGMVLPRILCQVINEAAFAITEDSAEPGDIDKALSLGAQFPIGPIKWAEQIGLDQVYAVLTALYSDLHEERYRIAPILKQMASVGVWWKQSIIQ